MSFVLEELDPKTHLNQAPRLAYIIWKAFGRNGIKIASGKDDWNPAGLTFRQQRLEIDLTNPRTRVLVIRRVSDPGANVQSKVNGHGVNDKGSYVDEMEDQNIVAVLVYRLPRSVVDADLQLEWQKIEPPQPDPPPLPAGSGKLLSEVREILNGMKDRHLNESTDLYLGLLGTMPEHQKQGLSKMLLKRFCEIADSVKEATFVTTGSARSLYDRYGWKVLEEVKVSWPASEDGKLEAGHETLYCMRRPALQINGTLASDTGAQEGLS